MRSRSCSPPGRRRPTSARSPLRSGSRAEATRSTPRGSRSTSSAWHASVASGSRSRRSRPRWPTCSARARRSRLYRREMLDSLGGLDRSFFAYLEDADLAWRARMAGWRCVLAPRAVALHRHSATLGHGSRAKHVLVGRNRVRMLAKNATARQLRRRLVGIVVYDLLYVAHEAVRGRTLAPLAGRLRGLARVALVPRRGPFGATRGPTAAAAGTARRAAAQQGLPVGPRRPRRAERLSRRAGARVPAARPPGRLRPAAPADRRHELARARPVRVLRRGGAAAAARRRARHVEGRLVLRLLPGGADARTGDELLRRRHVERATRTPATYGPEVARGAARPSRPALRVLLRRCSSRRSTRRRSDFADGSDRPPARRRLSHVRGRRPRRRALAPEARGARRPAPARHERSRGRLRRLAALGGDLGPVSRRSRSRTGTASACSPSASRSTRRSWTSSSPPGTIRSPGASSRRSGSRIAARARPGCGARRGEPRSRSAVRGSRGSRRASASRGRGGAGCRGAAGEPVARRARADRAASSGRARRTSRAWWPRRRGGSRLRCGSRSGTCSKARRLVSRIRRRRQRPRDARDGAAPAARPLPPASALSHRPLVSVVTPVYDTDPEWLGRAVESVRRQTYPHWQLCLADDGSTDPRTLAYLEEPGRRPGDRGSARRREPRASPPPRTWRSRRLAASSSPSSTTTTSCTPMRCSPASRVLNEQPETDVIYTDEDKIDLRGALTRAVLQAGLVARALPRRHVRRPPARRRGGRSSRASAASTRRYDGVQDFELMLRLSERTDRIEHVPRILYHWRKLPGSIAQLDRREGRHLRAAGGRRQRAPRSAPAIAAFARPHPALPHRATLQPKPRARWPRVTRRSSRRRTRRATSGAASSRSSRARPTRTSRSCSSTTARPTPRR